MSRLLITDELDHSKVADVLPSRALETVPIYDYYYLPSATGSGTAIDSACLLHSVIVGQTAASGNFLVLADMADTTSACPSTNTSSEKAIHIYGGVRGSYIVDMIINNHLCYRMSGEHDSAAATPGNDGITLIYKLIA